MEAEGLGALFGILAGWAGFGVVGVVCAGLAVLFFMSKGSGGDAHR